MDAAPSCSRQPLRFAGREVEQVHDGARDAEQVTNAPQHRLGDLDGRPGGDDGPVDLEKDAQALGVLGERFLSLLRLRDIDRDDQQRAPTRKGEGVRDDVNVSHPVIFKSVPAASHLSSDPPVRPLRHARHHFLEPRHVLRRLDVADTHPEELEA